MGEIRDIFGSMIEKLNADPMVAGAARFGRMQRDVERGGIGASLLLTLDREDFAEATGRIEAYKHIPAYTGHSVLEKVGKFIVGPNGPVRRAFDTQSEPSGENWEPLSKIQEKARGAKGPILDETGALKEAATSEAQMVHIAVTGQYARLILGPEENLQGTDRFKFFVHQIGSDNGWGMNIQIPARPFFPTSPNDLDSGEIQHVEQLIEEGVVEGVQKRATLRQARITRGMKG